MRYPDLADTAATTIRAYLVAAGLSITPATETYLVALNTRVSCWKGVFAASAAWLTTASLQEQACAWQAIIAVCNQDERPLAAMSRLWFFQSNAAALKTLWLALPVGALPALEVALAANPLLLAMFSDPTSGVKGLPTELADPTAAAAIWTKLQAKMAKLSRYENPAST
jgi:hypothetical protein